MKPLAEVPPPAGEGSFFYVQDYDVLPGRLPELEAWFRAEGAGALLAKDGVLGVETWVDLTRSGPVLSTVISFRDESSLRRFLDDHANEPLAQKFDEFIGPHEHRIFRRRPIYKATTLSAP